MLLGGRSHLLWRPDRLVSHRDIDELDAWNSPSGVAGSLLQVIGGWAAARRRGHHDVDDTAVVDQDSVNETEIDDVVAELRIDHEAKRFLDLLVVQLRFRSNAHVTPYAASLLPHYARLTQPSTGGRSRRARPPAPFRDRSRRTAGDVPPRVGNRAAWDHDR
ncbi:hypothetical protein MPL3365_180223 [Mesorhizobium plurifarium]|uniref:Uncharacterized protein n=1 Tax=Mesorhizobium plurifarium TaxID=69974 RepID=A0A090G054_MESPL|nr:hypothetical protein MPL3365_180223 [Mesorhizobium plurifarium]